MLMKLWRTLKILLETGQFKSAWWYFTFVGREKLDVKQEDLEIDYPDEEDKL